MYKLKKKYPTLPVDWEVGILVEIDKTFYSLVDKKYRQHYLYIYDVENNPEYWEKVVEKDYEILSILLRKSTKHEKRIVDNNDSEDYIISLINCDGNSIHSVKRLSDGEVFTVGDTTKEGKILDFDFPGSGKSECRYKIELQVLGGNWRMLAKAVKVVKVELGRTEDTGKPVYDGDKVFLLTSSWTCPEVVMSVNDYFKTPPRLFEHKKKAEEWILFNKKSFSINDIVRLCGPGYKKGLVEHLEKTDNGS